jgi:hypothetical protein
MRQPVAIENIDEMRRRQGIDDVELHEEIRGLGVGDFVRLTLSTSVTTAPVGETLLVRITSIKGGAFRGKLVDRPASSGLSKLPVGWAVAFTAAHIHSIPRSRPMPEPGD